MRINFKNLTVQVLLGIVLGIVIGFLFAILKYEGAEQMMLIGGTSIAIMFVALIAYSIYFSGFEKVRLYLIRSVVMGAVYVVLKFGTFI